jgi:maltose alpha-D-glucosyltransferase/alpha-amylase
MDPLYSYEAVNVENQQRSHFSLLNWTRRLISIRQQHSCFGRGVQTFLYPGNRKILAFLRECGDETILCVFNLSRAPQPMELDLSAYKGRVPIELTGGSNFPPIGDLPYLLTLTGYGFHWFLLATEADVPRWHAQIPEPMPELLTLVVRRDVSDLIGPREGDSLLRRILPSFLPKQRWFAAKNSSIANISLVGFADLSHENHHYPLMQVEVSFRGEQPTQRYFLPLSINTRPGVLEDTALLPYALARVRRMARVGILHDALAEEHFALAVIAAIREGRRIAANNGAIQFSSTQALHDLSLPAELHAQRLHVEQSHSSTVISDAAILKIYRRLFNGSHPEVEIGRFLTEVAQYRNAPALLGMITYQPEEGEATALGVLQQYIANQGDGWNYTIDYLERTFDQLLLNHVDVNEGAQERHQVYLQRIHLLGQRTAELHRAFATPTDDPEFAAEPVNQDDLALWRTEAQAQAQTAFATLEQGLGKLSEAMRNRAQKLLERREECLEVIANLADGEVQVAKTRLHGDYHLGQVLVAADDFYLVDFEGEPAANLAQRRRKHCVLRDVAGMLRSFDYATATVLSRISQRGGDPHGAMPAHAETWRETASAAFLAGYEEAIGDSPNWPADEAQRQRLLRLFLLQKALYEVCYEANNRPQWLEIPLTSVLEILNSTATVSGT